MLEVISLLNSCRIRKIKNLFFILFVFGFSHSQGQNFIISDISRSDNSNIRFEILGKFKGNVLIYKNISREHFLTKYDDSMSLIESVPLDFLPDKIFNMDFINYPGHIFLIYQYQQKNIVYCNAVKINVEGAKIGEPKVLDTTNVGFFADNKIYTTTYSEDKKRILIYKRNIKNDEIGVAARVFDENLQLTDSTRQVFPYDARSETYSDLAIDNRGNYVYAKETNSKRGSGITTIDFFVHPSGVDSFLTQRVALEKKFTEGLFIKADNLNKKFVLNSFCYMNRKKRLDGLFTVMLDTDSFTEIKTAYNIFSDSLRSKSNTSYQYSFDYENLNIKNVIMKKNGGFIILSEDAYSETIGNNNMWNRGFFNNMPMGGFSDYYLYNPYQYYGYRPFNNFGTNQTVRYYSNDIVVANVDSSLNLVWNSLIRKKQMDVDNDNFLSFSTFNSAGEIKFFFIERERTRQVISNQGLFPDGEIRRYATLKSPESRYDFMPRLAKQIGSAQMIIPFVYLGKIGFAKIEL
jgi:hypothetical protein